MVLKFLSTASMVQKVGFLCKAEVKNTKCPSFGTKSQIDELARIAVLEAVRHKAFCTRSRVMPGDLNLHKQAQTQTDRT